MILVGWHVWLEAWGVVFSCVYWLVDVVKPGRLHAQRRVEDVGVCL